MPGDNRLSAIHRVMRPTPYRRLNTLTMHRLSAHADGDKTFTQAEVDALIAERNSALESNRNEALKELKAAKSKLAAYDGVDPEEHKRLKTAAEEAERKKAAAEGDFNTLKAQLVANHQKELDGRDGKVTKLTKALEKRLIQAELTKAIAAKKGDPDLLLPYAERFVKTRETEDDFEAFVVDGTGNQRFSDGKATPMSFDAFVEQELMSKFPRAFDGTGSSGGGAPRSNAGGGGGARTIAAGDNASIIANLEGIASGKIEVSR